MWLACFAQVFCVLCLTCVFGDVFMWGRLGARLDNCLNLCNILRYNELIDYRLLCARQCDEDDGCYFFHHNSMARHCYVCTQQVNWHTGVASVQTGAFSANNTDTGVFSRASKQQEWDSCSVSLDCSVYRTGGIVTSGEYVITLIDGMRVQVYCDMQTDGGGWIVFQRRQDGSENFYRNWNDYETGFGNLSAEFWLGNAVLSNLTGQGAYKLRVDMENKAGDRRLALYSSFTVDGSDSYRLGLGAYSGDAGDSLTYHSGWRWTTLDVDNDGYSGNCAVTFMSAWWYGHCHQSNLNGDYGNDHYGRGINWRAFIGLRESLPFTEMKVRPASYTPPV